jgi:hypothetical protein
MEVAHFSGGAQIRRPDNAGPRASAGVRPAQRRGLIGVTPLKENRGNPSAPGTRTRHDRPARRHRGRCGPDRIAPHRPICLTPLPGVRSFSDAPDAPDAPTTAASISGPAALRTEPEHGHPSRGSHHTRIGIDRRDRGRRAPGGTPVADPDLAGPRRHARRHTADPDQDEVGAGRRRVGLRGTRRRRAGVDAGAHPRPADHADHRLGLHRLRPGPGRGRRRVGLGAPPGRPARPARPVRGDTIPVRRRRRGRFGPGRPHPRGGRPRPAGVIGSGSDADLVGHRPQRASQAAYASKENGRPRKPATRSAALPAPPGTSTRSR